MTRWPIRLRLTAAFALAMLLLLAAAGSFVYARVAAQLLESVDASLAARVQAAAASLRSDGGVVSAGGPLDPEEAFVLVLDQRSRVLEAQGGVRQPWFRSQTTELLSEPRYFDARIPGIEGTARVVELHVERPQGFHRVFAGQTLDDRSEALAGLLAAFALGGPLVVGLASLVGYGLASAGLAPVEAMRRRAAEISIEGDGTLPLPPARDEIHRLATTLNAMLARLRASFERERRFVADASHELRTPIAVIRAEVEAALRNGGYTPEVRESLAAALEECDHLAQLSEDLLVIARAGEGGLPVRREPVNARQMLEDARERFAGRAALQHRHIRVEADPSLEVGADPLRLRQALGNLVDNALRHGAGQITLTAARDDDVTVFAVADEGGGFPAYLAPKAFDRFTRGDEARTRGGAGLGLAIVADIAHAHGGEARIAPGDATRVELRL